MAAARAKVDQELITLDDAVELIRESWGLEKPPYSKKTLYNKISQKKLKRFGPFHCAMVDKHEILKKYGRNA